MTNQEVVKFLETYGYFSEVAPDVESKDLAKLKLDDEVVKDALKLYQEFDYNSVDLESVRKHGRHVDPDGDFGPATEAAMEKPRCGFPDFNPPGQMFAVGAATGRGNWRGCHGIGDFHAAVCQVDVSGMDPTWKEIWTDVLRLTQKINAELGLLWIFVDTNGKDMITGEDRRDLHVDTKCTFVRSAPGWIGLAIVGQGIQCGERTIWLKLLTIYGRNYPKEQRIWQITSLLAHELTHNEGWGHDGRSSIQAPSIGTHRQAPAWVGDSMEGEKTRAYGGKPVPIPGDNPDNPDPDPGPPTSVENRLRELERRQFQDSVTNAYQSAMLDWYGTRLNQLERT